MSTDPQEEAPMARRLSASSTTSSFDRRDENVLNVPYCGKHKDLLQYFCSDPGCSQLLCCQCLATGKHSDHDWKELRQAFNSLEARLEQAAHAAQEAADTARRHMDAVCTEKGRVVSKCNTAKDSICNKIRSIRNQLNDRQAHLKYNLDHAKRRQSYLNHKRPQETLKSKMDTLEDLWEHEDATIANLAARDLMSLGEVEKARGHLEKVKSDVRIIQQSVTTQHSSPLVSQFYADSEFVRAYLSNFGKVEVSTFTQVPGKHWTSYQPYEWNAGSSRPKERQRSASESVPNSASSASWKTRTTRCASLGSKHATVSSASKEQLLNIATSRRKSVMKNRELPPIPQESSHDQTGEQVQIMPSSTRRSTNILKNRPLPPVPQESPSDKTTNQMQTKSFLSSASVSLSSTSVLKDGALPHNSSSDQSTERPHSSAPGLTDTLTERVFVLPLFPKNPPFNPFTRQPHPLANPSNTASREKDHTSLQHASNLEGFHIVSPPCPPPLLSPHPPLHSSIHNASVAVLQYSDNKTEEIYEEPSQEGEYKPEEIYEVAQQEDEYEQEEIYEAQQGEVYYEDNDDDLYEQI